MDIDIKLHRSRVKKGWAAFCVDTRSIVANGKREFFHTKLEAERHVDKIKAELTPSTAAAWDWDFDMLYSNFITYIKSEHDKGDMTTSSKSEKERDAKLFVGLTLDGKPVGQSKVRDLTTGHMRLQIIDQLRVGRAKKTVDNILGSLRYFINFSIDSGCRNSNPMIGVKGKGDKVKQAKKIKRIQPDTIAAIIDAMPVHWALRARFAATTGLRQGEQRALTWADIDWESSYVSVNKAVEHRAGVGKTKTVKGNRKVPLHPDVKQSLQELYLMLGRPSADKLVFPNVHGDILGTSRFLTALHIACDAAGVERIRWHDLRHYYASCILQVFQGDWWTITNLMGHASINTTTNIYGHWLDDKERDDKIASAIAGAF
jgi:integrase